MYLSIYSRIEQSFQVWGAHCELSSGQIRAISRGRGNPCSSLNETKASETISWRNVTTRPRPIWLHLSRDEDRMHVAMESRYRAGRRVVENKRLGELREFLGPGGSQWQNRRCNQARISQSSKFESNDNGWSHQRICKVRARVARTLHMRIKTNRTPVEHSR